ncbi:MAG: hypothetical protein KFH98_14340, partial [Gemmatimonadetes bacterium]|nr:hypothetical protein [Gemmatimonadota bacterium]
MRPALRGALTLTRSADDWRKRLITAAILAGAAVASAGLAFSPFLTLGAVVGAVLTLFALTKPLALVGLML